MTQVLTDRATLEQLVTELLRMSNACELEGDKHGYIFDSQRHMVADNGPICDGPSVEGAVASRVRGWGRIGYMPNAAELQDEVGQMMADALNALYQVPPFNAVVNGG